MKLKENVDLKVLEELGFNRRKIENSKIVSHIKIMSNYKFLYIIEKINDTDEICITRWNKKTNKDIKLSATGKLYKQLIKDLIEKGLVE